MTIALRRPAPSAAPGSSSRRSDLLLDLATPADDAELRRLLRDNPMDGAIRVSLEREPNVGLAAAVEGEPHDTVVARDPATGRIVGMGSRVGPGTAFVDGAPCRLGLPVASSGSTAATAAGSGRGRRVRVAAGSRARRTRRRST